MHTGYCKWSASEPTLLWYAIMQLVEATVDMVWLVLWVVTRTVYLTEACALSWYAACTTARVL